MSQPDQRSRRERRSENVINANPPYLTKQGTILYRRKGVDRREATSAGLHSQPAAAPEEEATPAF
jgi:hypothetical protein